jgi:hypothetical protein
MYLKKEKDIFVYLKNPLKSCVLYTGIVATSLGKFGSFLKPS